MKFTIRDLLWLTVVVALGVGLWVDRSRQASRADLWERRSGMLHEKLMLYGFRGEWGEDGELHLKLDLSKSHP